jgi:iron(III) transport system permease protein
MEPNSRMPSIVGTLGISLLVLVPLLGLLNAIIDRPADPFSGETPTLEQLIHGARVWNLLLHSVLLAVVVAVGSVLAGGWMAWVEYRTHFKGHRWITLLALLPMAMPSYIVAASVRSALSPGGWIGDAFGLPQMTGSIIASLVLIAVTAPLSQLIIGAALQRCSAAEEEAARSLGASPWRVFTSITMPHLRSAIGFSGLIALLYAISDFGAVAVLDMPVLTWRLYSAVEGQEVAKAAVLGAALLLATLPLFVVSRWVRGEFNAHSVANPRQVAPRPLTALPFSISILILMLTVGLGLVIPILTLGSWVAEGLSRNLEFVNPISSVVDTLFAAILGAFVTLLFAWFPAWAVALKQRKKQRAGILEDATYVTSALPGVLLALGLMAAALQVTKHLPAGAYASLLGTGLLLMLGYSTRFVAEVFAPLRVAFLSLDPRQEESARVLGASTWKRWRKVTLPALAPGLAVAWVIGFNAIVKELPVTLLLGGATGLRTLSFRVWDRYNESLWHDAGLAGLLLVALALGSVLMTLSWRRHA